MSTGGRTRRDHRVRSGSRGSRWGLLLGGLGVGVALSFVLGAVAEVMVTPGGWEAVSQDLLYPLAFLLAVGGVLLGAFLLVAAEQEGNQQRAWRAAAVFVSSAVLAALLFWGNL